MFKWKKASELDSKAMVKSWSTYAVLITVAFTMMFFGVCDPSQSGFLPPSGAAAKVDGETISALQFRRAYIAYSNQLQQQYKDKFDPVQMGVATQVLNSLVDQTALYLEAHKSGLYASDEEVEKIILDGDFFKGESGKFDPALLNRYLKAQGHTEETLTEELRRNITTNKFRSLISNSYRNSEKLAELNYLLDETKLDVEYLRIDPSKIPIQVADAEVDAYLKDHADKEIKEYYEKNKSEFNQEAKVKARHILIAYKGSRNASGEAANRSKEDAKALAEKVLGEAQKAPGSFADLAGKYTDEASGKAKGGDLGFFKRDQMVKEFADAAFAMKAGDISKVVESPFGFHIIKVDTTQDAKSVSFDEAKRDIAQKLVSNTRRPALLDEKVKGLLTAVKEGKGIEEMKALELDWKATGPFSMGARFIPGIGADKPAARAIASLKKPGDIYPEALDINGARFIVRLKSRQEADVSKLTSEKRKELADSSKYMDSYMLFASLTDGIRKSYDAKKLVYRNPEFVDYDRRLRGEGAPE